MGYFEEVTEEMLPKLKLRYYRGYQEIKVGDKIIWGFTSENLSDEEVKLNMKCFVLDGKFIYELKQK